MVTDHTSSKEQGKIFAQLVYFFGDKALYMYNNVLGKICSQVKPEFLLSPKVYEIRARGKNN